MQHTGYDITSDFRSEIIAKNCRKCRLRRLWLEFLQNGFNEDDEIVCTCWGQSASQTCRIGHNWLLLVGCKMQLNTAQRCVRWVWPANSRITRPLFNVDSPNCTRTLMPTQSTATPDMTSQATSGRHLSKFEKQLKIPP